MSSNPPQRQGRRGSTGRTPTRREPVAGQGVEDSRRAKSNEDDDSRASTSVGQWRGTPMIISSRLGATDALALVAAAGLHAPAADAETTTGARGRGRRDGERTDAGAPRHVDLDGAREDQPDHRRRSQVQGEVDRALT